MDDNENGTESNEAIITRLARELEVARNQRSLLGQVLTAWVTRYYALKIANGDLHPTTLQPFIDREMRELDHTCNQIAEQTMSSYTT